MNIYIVPVYIHNMEPNTETMLDNIPQDIQTPKSDFDLKTELLDTLIDDTAYNNGMDFDISHIFKDVYLRTIFLLAYKGFHLKTKKFTTSVANMMLTKTLYVPVSRYQTHNYLTQLVALGVLDVTLYKGKNYYQLNPKRYNLRLLELAKKEMSNARETTE